MRIIIVLFLFTIEVFGQGPILGTELVGKASYYGPKFHGKTTANGEKMDKNAFTCAHKTLPFGTMIEVENPRNNKRVIVRVNDRGPYSGNRIIDVSLAAAQELGMINRGVVNVKATIVGKDGEIIITRPSITTEILTEAQVSPLIDNTQEKEALEKKRAERKNE